MRVTTVYRRCFGKLNVGAYVIRDCVGSTADYPSLASNALAIVGAGAIPAICKAMAARAQAVAVADAGCVALHNLAGVGHAAACREAGAAALVEAVRRQHPQLHTRVDMLAEALAVGVD